MAAYQITRNASKVNPFTPDAPVWVLVPAAVLKEAGSLPAGTRAFAIALENAERVVFSIGPDGDHLQVGAERDVPESGSGVRFAGATGEHHQHVA